MANKNFQNKNILITGASGGIGAEIAKQCAEKGANLYLFARSLHKLEEIREDLQKRFGVQVRVYQLDVSDTEAVSRVFSKALKEIEHVDVLVNNAGFGIFNSVIDATLDEMKAMFEVNVFGLMAVTKMVLPKLIEQEFGHIINVASQAGKLATPKSSIYSASKHAVLGFTNSLRMEVKSANVFVTAVNPGPIRTNFFSIADKEGNYLENLGRWILEPEYVARHVVKAIETPKREINLPRWMGAGTTLYHLMPRFVELVARNAFFKK